MQFKWLTKSATAIVMVALMAAETVNPVPAYAGVPGVFATEYTQILNYLQLIGSLEKQVLMVENQLTQIADMAKHGVTIFFQGHDHLFARQERDGIVYQEVPMPADQGYVAYNEDRYGSGVKLPNSGHLRVTVSPEQVKVDYVRSFLSQDETAQQKTGDIAHSYTIKAKASHA